MSRSADQRTRSCATELVCHDCGIRLPLLDTTFRCLGCGQTLDIDYDYELAARRISEQPIGARELNIWRFEELLPIVDASAQARVGRYSGRTPLIHADRLGAEPVGVDQRRSAAVAADPRLRAGIDDRQQLLEAPDVELAGPDRLLGNAPCGQLVVVVDVEGLAAAQTPEGRIEKGKSNPTVVADQLRRAGAGALVGREAHRPSEPPASDGRPPAFANLRLRFPCWRLIMSGSV